MKWLVLMDSDKKAEIKSHVLAIAKLLYLEVQSDDIKTLADIEKIVRAQVLEHVSPDIGIFLSKNALKPRVDAVEQ